MFPPRLTKAREGERDQFEVLRVIKELCGHD